MPTDYFISDQHFGHNNILKYETDTRPFESLVEMETAMIKAHNQKLLGVASPRVFHVGDFAFKKDKLKLLRQMAGTHFLIMGNHDCFETSSYLSAGFQKIYGCLIYKGGILSHIPVHNNEGGRFNFNIHGHLHSKIKEDTRFYKNVSCEQLPNLAPIAFDEILFNA